MSEKRRASQLDDPSLQTLSAAAYPLKKVTGEQAAAPCNLLAAQQAQATGEEKKSGQPTSGRHPKSGNPEMDRTGTNLTNQF